MTVKFEHDQVKVTQIFTKTPILVIKIYRAEKNLKTKAI